MDTTCIDRPNTNLASDSGLVMISTVSIIIIVLIAVKLNMVIHTWRKTDKVFFSSTWEDFT